MGCSIIRENEDALARCSNLKRNAVARLFADEITRATPVQRISQQTCEVD